MLKSGAFLTCSFFFALAAMQFDDVQGADDLELDSIPVQKRTPQQKILLVADIVDEIDAFEAQMGVLGIPFEVRSEIDFDQERYDEYFAIIIGTNMTKLFKGKEPEVFQPLEGFMREGGHVLFCGTFNGVDYHVIKKFGVRTSFYHSGFIRMIPGRSEALVSDYMHLAPEDFRSKSFGNFTISKPHIQLLLRGNGSLKDQSAFSTMPVGRGRLSINMFEYTGGG